MRFKFTSRQVLLASWLGSPMIRARPGLVRSRSYSPQSSLVRSAVWLLMRTDVEKEGGRRWRRGYWIQIVKETDALTSLQAKKKGGIKNKTNPRLQESYDWASWSLLTVHPTALLHRREKISERKRKRGEQWKTLRYRYDCVLKQTVVQLIAHRRTMSTGFWQYSCVKTLIWGIGNQRIVWTLQAYLRNYR